MSVYKYISICQYDQSCMLCIQIINNMEMYRGVSTYLPPSLVVCNIQYLYFVRNKSTTFFYTLHYILYKGKEKVCEKQTSIKKNRKK